MKNFKSLLFFLISNISITGISFVDGRIWDVIFVIVGMVAYSIVGWMFSINLIVGKKAGKDAFTFVSIGLVLIGYEFYKFLVKVRVWILDLPFYFKITVLALLLIALILVVLRKILSRKQCEYIGDYYA